MFRPANLKIPVLLFLAILFCLYSYDHIASADPKMDFLSFYVAGQNYDHINIYDVAQLNASAGTPDHIFPYVYSPFIAALIHSIPQGSLLPMQRINSILTIVLAAFIFLISTRGIRDTRKITLYAAAYLVTITALLDYIIEIGQVDIYILFLAVSGVSVFARKELPGIFLFALAVFIKPIVLPFLLFFLLSENRHGGLVNFRALYLFLLSLALLFLFFLPLTGTLQWANYLAYIGKYSYGQTVEGLGPVWRPENHSLISFFCKLTGNDLFLSRICTFSFAGIFTLLLLRIKSRYGYDTRTFLLPVLTITVLISPFAWRQHLVYVIPGAIATLIRLHASESRRKPALAAVLLISVFIINFLPTRFNILIDGGISYHFLSCVNSAVLIFLAFFSVYLHTIIFRKRISP